MYSTLGLSSLQGRAKHTFALPHCSSFTDCPCACTQCKHLVSTQLSTCKSYWSLGGFTKQQCATVTHNPRNESTYQHKHRHNSNHSTYLRGALLLPSSRCRTAAGTSAAVNTVARSFQLLRSWEVYNLKPSDSQSQCTPSVTFCFWLLPYLWDSTASQAGTARGVMLLVLSCCREACASGLNWGWQSSHPVRK